MFQISPQKKIDLFQSFISGFPESGSLDEIFEHFFQFIELFYTPLSKDLCTVTALLNKDTFDFEVFHQYPQKLDETFLENQINEIIDKNFLSDCLNDGRVFPISVESHETYFSKIIIPLASLGGPVGYLLLFTGTEKSRIPQDYIDLLKMCSFQLGTWVKGLQLESIKNEFDKRINNAVRLETRRLEEHNQELEKLRKKADSDRQKIIDSNQSKSDFLSSVSHELRTPLSSILGFTDLLSSEHLSDQAREYLYIIQKSSEGLLTVINDILEFTQVENHSLKLQETPFDLVNEIESVINLLDITAKDRGLELTCEFSGIPHNQWLVGDPFRLRQVLISLLNNAINNTIEGFVKLWIIGSENTAQQTQRLKFVVEDSGRGYNPIEIKNLFNSFAYADKGGDDSANRLGLGLAISRKLVEKMGGNLNATSTEGKGSEFYFTIDLARSLSSHPKEKELQAEYEKLIKRINNCKALIVEDNLFNRKLLRKILTGWNFEVIEAGNGKEAIELMHSELNPDIVLMDFQMPIMDGIEATNYIRIWEAKNQRQRVPIVALTAKTLREERDYFLTAGFDEYLLKPFSKTDLLKTFLRIFKKVES